MTLFEVRGESCSKFYSRHDRRRFEIQLVQDARRVASVVGGSSANISHDDLFECIGIEKIMKPENARQAQESRRRHVQAIVARQYSCSSDDLGRMARASSQQDRKMATKLAVAYMNMESLQAER
ncbi:hypothetical protein ACHAWF_006393 [Thalassiosira exigua]